MYPEYQAPTARLARYFGVRPEELLLTNGGDDALRSSSTHSSRPRNLCPDLRTDVSHVSAIREIYGLGFPSFATAGEMEFPLQSVVAQLRKKRASSLSPIPTIQPELFLVSRNWERILRAARTPPS